MLRWGRALPEGTIFTGDFVKQSSNKFEERPAWTQSSSTVNIISISIYYKLRGNWRKTYIVYSHCFCISRSQMLALHHTNRWCLVELFCWPADLCYLGSITSVKCAYLICLVTQITVEAKILIFSFSWIWFFIISFQYNLKKEISKKSTIFFLFSLC